MVSLNSTATTPRIEVVGPSRSLLHSEPKINQKLDRFILATNVTENHKRPRLLNDSRSLNLFIRQFSCYSNGNEKSGTKNPEQHLGPISTTEFSFVWDNSGLHRIRNRLKLQSDESDESDESLGQISPFCFIWKQKHYLQNHCVCFFVSSFSVYRKFVDLSIWKEKIILLPFHQLRIQFRF